MSLVECKFNAFVITGYSQKFFCVQGLERHSLLDINNREDKYEIVLGMKELASKGMAAEVVEEVNALDPNFFVENPTLLFQLKQVCRLYIANGFIKNTLRTFFKFQIILCRIFYQFILFNLG